MKHRLTSLLLASCAVLSLTLPAFAAAMSDVPEEEEVVVEQEEVTPVYSPLYLNGMPAETLEYEFRDGVCYVTVQSLATALCSEAMVEEEDGVVAVTASTVAAVVDVADADLTIAEEENAEEGMPAGEETPECAEPAESAEPTEPVEANVEEETLTLSASAGSSYLVANGRYLYAPDGIILCDGKVAAPVRVLARVFNLSVDYDGARAAVLLDRQEGASAFLEDGDSYYDEDTLYWLSHIIHAESGNQPLVGRLAVGNVVMNRVANPLFPNNIKDVLFQKNQFSPASSGSIYKTPSESSVIAAKLVMDGACVVENALFFNRAGLNSYAARNRTYVTTIGVHAFYK